MRSRFGLGSLRGPTGAARGGVPAHSACSLSDLLGAWLVGERAGDENGSLVGMAKLAQRAMPQGHEQILLNFTPKKPPAKTVPLFEELAI